MAKQVGDKIQVEAGDTLYGIYGANWRQLSGYTGDPTKLAVGTLLPGVATSQQKAPTVPTQQQALNPAQNPNVPTPAPQQNNSGLTLKQQMEKGLIPWDDNAIAAENNRIAAGNGTLFKAPSIDVQSIYNKALETPEYKAALSKVDEVNAKIKSLTDAYNTALANEENNPFYSAATLQGKIDKIDKKYRNDILAQNQQLALAQDAVNTIKANATTNLNMALKQYDIQTQQYQQSLQTFNGLLSAGGLNNASSADVAQFATTLGVSTQIIQNLIDTQKKKDVSPQLVQATDSNGNVTIAAVDKYTGQVINTSVLSGAGKGSGGVGSGTASQKLIDAMKADIAGGALLKDVITKYKGKVSDANILSIYNTTSPYGAAKENAQQLAVMFGQTKAVPFAQLSPDEKAAVNQAKIDINNGSHTRDEIINRFPWLATYL